MVDEELVEAVKAGLSRGQSIDSVMNSLINAGYKESEIDQAITTARSGVSIIPSPISQPQKSLTPISQPSQVPQGDVTQRESKYEYIPKSVKNAPRTGKILIIVLAIIFILLIAGLLVVIFFKDKITSLFGASLSLFYVRNGNFGASKNPNNYQRFFDNLFYIK
ncbi:MAG: hypothetical protein Q7R52_05080 [archaeon]|nr:hypothetical protein [archaeon]